MSILTVNFTIPKWSSTALEQLIKECGNEIVAVNIIKADCIQVISKHAELYRINLISPSGTSSFDLDDEHYSLLDFESISPNSFILNEALTPHSSTPSDDADISPSTE